MNANRKATFSIPAQLASETSLETTTTSANNNNMLKGVQTTCVSNFMRNCPIDYNVPFYSLVMIAGSMTHFKKVVHSSRKSTIVPELFIRLLFSTCNARGG